MIVRQCRMCRGTLTLKLSLAPTPIANAFSDEPNVGEKHPLNLMECGDCGHVQLDRVLETFDDYKYRTPKAYEAHLRDTAAILKARYPRAKKIVEIGSNNGLNTEILQKAFSGSVIGVDPAGCHWACWKMPFDETVASRIHKRVGDIDLVIANNAFAHIDDLHEVFRGIDYVLSDQGAVVFEVQDFQASLDGGIFDMCYHEHLDYHRPGPWIGFLREHGFELSAVEHIEPHGGSLRLTASRFGKTDWVDPPINWAEYRRKIERVKSHVRESVPYGSVAWGATAKLTTMIHECDIADRIDYCVDSTPEKQGKYLPGTGIVIEPMFHKKGPGVVLTGAWNYIDEFKKQYPLLMAINPYDRSN